MGKRVLPTSTKGRDNILLQRNSTKKIMKIVEWLRLPEVRNIENLDAISTSVLHGRIIRKKGFLRKLYTDFYKQFLRSSKDLDGLLIELGSGGGFLKEVIPNVITSDILPVEGVDLCFSALLMPFPNQTVSAFLMIDVLHHLPDSFLFFKEVNRCLKVGGKCVMIEPANTLWSRFVYQNLHHEDFDPNGEWGFEGRRPLSDANGAIPWIIFCRDRKRFEKEFPDLKIAHLSFSTPFRYLLSGGLSVRSLVPSFFYNTIKGVEFLLSPLNRYLGMFMKIELEKK
ncbi:MAG: class I SAM-dependent methyltransferase [Nitrospirae bacterium]|nr:class I SAM-dependent methyltransferase [Nitrospirota bacterium]